MRTNITKVLEAWLVGKPAKGDSKQTCSTDGRIVYSYAMPIAWWDGSGAVIVRRDVGPSMTTKGQIQACWARIARTDYAVTEATRPLYASECMQVPERPVEPAHECAMEPCNQDSSGAFAGCKCGEYSWAFTKNAHGIWVCKKCSRHWALAMHCQKCGHLERPETFPEPDACEPGTDPFEFACEPDAKTEAA